VSESKGNDYTHDSVNQLLFRRELDILDLWMWRRECNNRTVENSGFHGTAHHGIGEQGANTPI
jgi:hypothetical protein